MSHYIKMRKRNRGFTLIELMVSLSVFVVIMSLVMGSILSVLNLNAKAQSKKTAIDNLNFAVESMSRTIRFGTNYHCGNAGNALLPNDCAAGDSTLWLANSDGIQTGYYLSGGVLMRAVRGVTAALTSPEVTIQSVSFRVFGSYPYGVDYLQPQVIITITGVAGSANKANTQSTFRMETTISQRKLDI